MRIYISIILFFFLASCNQNQSDSIIKVTIKNTTIFDVSLIDTLVKQELKEMDSSDFNKYIAKNPVVLGENFDTPRLYSDGFWIMKYADSIKSNIIFNTFQSSKYYILENPINNFKTKGIFVLIVYKPATFSFTEHIALYLINYNIKHSYPETILLAEKFNKSGLSTTEELTSSTLCDSILIRKTTHNYCASDLPNSNWSFDTTTVFYRLTEKGSFVPFRKTFIWDIGE